jgi:hypothetical protein
MESISRVLFKGDHVYWNHTEHGTVPVRVIQDEDGLSSKIKVVANLPHLKHPSKRWVMKVRLLEDSK